MTMALAQQTTQAAVDDPTAVAVIGVACRFGPLDSPSAYWDLLVRGGTALRRYSRDELLALGHDPSGLDRPGFVAAGCPLRDADRFDATLFGFNPRQAQWLDPQQRLLLELAWAALEDSALAPDRVPGRTGVFASSARPTLSPVGITALDAAGMARFSSADRDFTATLVAHRLGLTGPALSVQTACSSSLVGVHLAVESLLAQSCDTAVVGAVSLHLPQAGYPSAPDMILSPTGVCRPFDDRADGTVFGNGGGALVLRRLSDALRDGDPIRAVVRGSAVNNDGADRQDYQAPSPGGQAEALGEALAVGAVDPADVGYVEAHGTGTPLGDPVEFSALRRAYGAGGPGARPCALGSAKSVVGHLNTAAGLAGLVKAVLALENGIVPPQHGYDRPNPLLELADSRFFVPRSPVAWPVPGGPRRAAVSSFGIGGTNAHVVLEQAPEPAPAVRPAARPVALLLSARTDQAVRQAATRLAEHLEGPGGADALCDVARTLREGRSLLPRRIAVVADAPLRAAALLRSRAAGQDGDGADEGGRSRRDDSVLGRAARAWESGESDDVPDGELPGAARDDAGNARGGAAARRTRLPGYAFDHGRTWPLSGPDPDDAPPGGGGAAGSRPASVARSLPWRNTSTLHGVSFARDIDPADPLVGDHVVAGRPLVPAALFMELVRAAAASAAGVPQRRLEDITFRQPAGAREPLTLRTAVSAAPDGSLEVRVASGAEPSPVVHVTARVPGPATGGIAELAGDAPRTEGPDGPGPEGGGRELSATADAPARADIRELRERCTSSLSPDGLYAFFAAHDVHYGPAYRVVEDFHYGEDDALARLTDAPEPVSDAAPAADGDFVLAPPLLDGALQSVIGFLAHSGGARERCLPFAVDRLDVFGPVPPGAYVHAARTRRPSAGGRVHTFDITVLATDGTVRVVLGGLTLRPTADAEDARTATDTPVPGGTAASSEPAERKPSAEKDAASGAHAVHILEPVRVPLAPAGPTGGPSATSAGTVVAIGGSTRARSALAERLGPLAECGEQAPATPEEAAGLGRIIAARAREDLARGTIPGEGEAAGSAKPLVVWLGAQTPPSGPGPDRVVDQARNTVALVRELLRPLARSGAVLRIICPATAEAGGTVGAGLAALGRSLVKENPRFDLCAVSLPGGLTDEESARAVAGETGPSPAAHHVVVELARGVRAESGSGEFARSTFGYRRTDLAPRPAGPGGLRTGGRYWINGGGRLGLHLAAHLLRAYQADVLLTGRRERLPGDAELTSLRELAGETGGRVEHLVADTTDTAALKAVAARLDAQGRAPHGVFHCAGSLRDGFLLTKEPDTVREVTAPKVLGTAALDAATAGLDLDFFVAFSSVSAALGSAGQADYAYANAAMDHLLEERAESVRAGLRSGRTLSVSWPLWAEGGMSIPGDPAEVLGAFGAAPLPTAAGLSTLESLLAEPGDPAAVPVRRLVLHGDLVRLEATLLDGFVATAGPGDTSPDADADTDTAPDVARHGGTAGPARPEAAAPGPDDDARLLEVVRGILADATGHEPALIEDGTLFDDLGVDSLTAIRAVDQLSARFGRLPRTLLFECRTAAELAAHLREELPAEVRARALGGPPAGPDRGTTVPEVTATAESTDSAVLAPGPLPPADTDTRPIADTDTGTGTGTRPIADTDADTRSIAVIGVAGRFPDAPDLDAFWQNLLDGRDSVSEIPADRWPLEGFYLPERDRPNTSYAKWGGFLDGIDRFDAPLFNISAREAGTIDPQARLFLESCWAAIEDSGYTPDALAPATDPRRPRDVGVYVGAMYSEYQVHEGEERLRGNPVHANSAFWCIANRASYFFGFEGPSIALDTACSSGLSSLHLACEALRAGSCSVAVAGAVNVSVHPNKYLMLSQGRFLSSDGRCRSFGAGGDGYVPGEGVAAVVLKPLAAARRDGDQIHAVIRGSAVNHGGRTNGYTVPNPKAQANLVGKSLADAGLTARDLSYVEAHGTGTPLGDPLEIRGLASAFARDGWTAPVRAEGADEPGGARPPGGTGSSAGRAVCPIGSVKSNIGHLESAAGMAAFAKVLLQFRHRTLVASLHADPPNPDIDFTATPFTVQRENAPWNPAGPDGAPTVRRAGISSFGAGGANAHVVVEEGPGRRAAAVEDGAPLTAFLSARTPRALAASAGRLRRWLSAEWASGGGPERADVAFTLAVGRVQLGCRAAARSRSREELLAALTRIEAGEQEPPRGDAADAWLSGGRADLRDACGAGETGRRVSLPHYPFERIRCWYDNQFARHAPRPDDAPVVRGPLRGFGLLPAGDVEGADAPEEAAADRVTGNTAVGAGERTAGAPEAPEPEARPELKPARVSEPAPVSGPDPGPDPGPTSVPGPPAPAGTPAAVTSQTVRDMLLDVLGSVLLEEPSAIGADRPFEEMGLDSLLSEELVVAVGERLGLAIDAALLFEHTTVNRLAAHLSDRSGPAPADAPAPPSESGAHDRDAENGPDAVLASLERGLIDLDEAVSLLEGRR
ncbi:beta-ketoacyl synthase N-terminal-like domain-containing protein [Streptomyces fimicarius]|uniref:beta-ketoacyl synthase N-terminal-like domain-containing protein n=1 Tax=Streptomyces griseus TaxID=1911 RepID=UPI00369213B4